MNALRSLSLAVPPRLHISAFLPMGGRKRGRVYLARLTALVAAFILCAAGARAATLTVNTTADSSDASGSCGTGTCSLRDAINQANAQAGGGDVIDFSVSGTIALTSALPAITQNLTIGGPGASQLTVSGAGNAIFQVGPGTNVTISGMTITNGSSAISVNASATVTVQNCAFAANTATSGGAIDNAGTANVAYSTFSGNSAQQGGALFNASGATMTVVDNTFTQNSASAGGGAIQNDGTLTATNNTFYANSASGSSGGAIFNASGASGVLTANNNIFANNTASSLGAGVYNTGGDTANANYNVYFNNLANGSEDDCNGCTTNANPTPATTNPLALPLGNYGGTTQTFLPLPGSAAICVGLGNLASAAGLNLDQRGFALNPSGNASCAAGFVDAGAVQTSYIQVQNNADAGAGAGDCPGANCTLRDAIALASSAGDVDFASGITAINLDFANGALTLSALKGVEIVGPGANLLTINGNGDAAGPLSVFTVNSGTQALLYGLTVTGGYVIGNGGGVNNSGTLLLDESAIANNLAGGNGGGVSNSGALTVVDSTINGNMAAGNGGGIYSGGTGAATSITESTIYGNSVGGSDVGGGIYNADSMSIADSTIWGNSSSDGTGGLFSNGTLALANSVVANNSGAAGFANINGAYTGSGDVIGGGDSTNTAEAGGTGAAITMSSLQLNGAKDTVPTLIPLPGGTSGNPVICAGSASSIPSGITTDERGYSVENTTYTGYSSASPCVDAGAVQTDYSMSFTTAPTQATVDLGFGAEVTLDENGAPSTASGVSIPVTITSGGTLYGSGVVSGTASQSTVAGVATFSGLTATAGSGETLTSTLSLNAGLTTPLSLTASSSSFDVNPAVTSIALTSNTGANSSTGAAGSSAVNQSVTFTATVSAPTGAAVPLTGNVTFSDNGTTITNGSSCGTAGVVAVTWSAATATGTASCTTSELTGGTHAIVAAYSNDASYLASNNDVTESVGLVATTVTAPTASPSSPSVNQTVTVTATVAPSGGGTPTVAFSGTMEFFNNGTAISNCTAVTVTPTSTGATASCPISGLTASSTAYLITAQYKTGDSSYSASSVSTSLSLTVSKASVNISLISSAANNSSTVNQSVTFTATVTENPTGSTPLAGTVAFTDNGTTITGCSAVTPSPATGAAACPDTALDAQHSPHAIQAAYSGDSNFANNSSQPLTQTVTQANTSTVVSSSVNPSVVGQQVTFTALVTPVPGSVGLSTAGTVNFTDSATGKSILNCSTQPITITNGVGQSTCATTALAVDSGSTAHTITASYGNDPNFNTSSGTVQQTVNPVSSSISLSSAGASTVNQTVTFTATIAVSTTQPALVGTVAFTDSALPSPGTIPNCSAQAVTELNTSTWIATCQDTNLVAGSHTITAQYSGDKNLSVGNGTWTQTMNPAQSTIMISGGTGIIYVQNPNGLNDSVTLTAGVMPTNGIALSGVVTFNGVPSCQGAAASAPATLPVSPASGQAACTTTTLPAGANTITASYSGDVNYTNASSLNAGSNQSVVVNVSDYSISMVNVPTGSAGVQVTQGFTTAADSSGAPVDPFAPAHPIAVTPTSIGSFSSSAVAITCTSTAAGAPACLPGGSTSASLQIAAGSVVQQSINITIDASGANVAPGTYTFTVTAIDSTTGLTRTTSFPVSIRPASEGASALNLVSGSMSNNSTTVSFLLPQGITLSSFACAEVVGTDVTSAAAPGSVGMACGFSPTSLGSSASTGPQTVTTTVTVTTNNTIAAVKPLDVGNRRPLLLVAGFLLPLFGLIGVRRKSFGATFFRMIAIAAIGIAAFQSLGCGGSYHSSNTVVSGGTTPPGTYYLLVQGTGSDGKNYQAVLQVNVNL